MSSHKSARDYMELVLRKKHLTAGIALGVLIAAVVVSFFLPRKYESVARVRVVDNAALYNLYGRRLAGAKDAGERARAMREGLLSRKSISAVLDTLEAGGAPDGIEDRDGLIAKIRADSTVDVAENGRGQFALEIRHQSSDPAMAQRVVTHLATTWQKGRYAEQEEAGAGTLAEIRGQVSGTGSAYASALEELAAFEEKNAEFRFGSQDDTRARHAELVEKRGAAEGEIAGYEMKLENIREQLEDEPEWIEVQEKIGNEIEISGLKRELREAQAALGTLTTEHGSEHATVKAQHEKVAAIEKKLEQEQSNLRTRTRRERNETYVELQKSEMETLSALTVKQRLFEEYSRRSAALEEQMAAYPALKERWDGLVARTASLKAELGSLRDQEEAARITWQTKVAENTLIYDVVQAPVYPGSPVSPNRIMLAIGGLMLGLGIGVATVLAKDSLDHSFRYTEEVAAVVEVPVLGSIAKIETVLEREESKRRQRSAAVAVAVLLLLAGAAVFLQMTFDESISSFLRNTVSLG